MIVIWWILEQLESVPFQLMFAVYLTVMIIENVLPVIRVPAGHYTFNLSYALVNSLLAVLIGPFIALGIAVLTRNLTHGLIDLRWMGFRGFFGTIFAVTVSTAVFDFFYYWLHRTQHTSAILWQEHLLHHSDEHVNVTTSSRTHILEQFLFPAFIAAPSAILFQFPAGTVAAIGLFPTVWAFLVHANVRIGFGRFWWLLASPQYHRIHHSIEEKHFNRNYAVWFPLWDIVFGTAHRPERNEYPRTGVTGVEVKTIREAYLLPFRRWHAMIKMAYCQYAVAMITPVAPAPPAAPPDPAVPAAPSAPIV